MHSCWLIKHFFPMTDCLLSVLIFKIVKGSIKVPGGDKNLEVERSLIQWSCYYCYLWMSVVHHGKRNQHLNSSKIYWSLVKWVTFNRLEVFIALNVTLDDKVSLSLLPPLVFILIYRRVDRQEGTREICKDSIICRKSLCMSGHTHTFPYLFTL